MKVKILLSAMLLVLMFSCKKKPFNYRNKYIGNWEFQYSIRKIEYSPNRLGSGFVLTKDTTISGTYSGKVFYYDGGWGGTNKHEISINYASDNEVNYKVSTSLVFTIDKKGNLSTDDGSSYGSFSDTKNISFTRKEFDSGWSSTITTTATVTGHR